MTKLLIGTTNPGKIAEFQRLLLDLPYQLVTPGDVGIREIPEEETISIEANARAKVEYYGKKSKLMTIADDGGFEIDALGGAPGVLSRRWPSSATAMEGAALVEATDEQLIDYTLQKMRGIPIKDRGAQIRTVVVLRMPDGHTVMGQGIMRGSIAETLSQKRTRGFPFRDILWIPERGKLYSEFNEAERRQFNHRAIALRPIREHLQMLGMKMKEKDKKSIRHLLIPNP